MWTMTTARPRSSVALVTVAVAVFRSNQFTEPRLAYLEASPKPQD